jgi:hypothetical protein
MVLAVAAAGCGSGSSMLPAADQGTRTISKGGAVSGSGAVGGTSIPQPSTDAPAWFIYNGSAVLGSTAPPNVVDFGALQNMVQGAMAIGTSRSAQVLIFNISKKADLIISGATIVGPNAGDFHVDAAVLNQPFKKSTGTAVNVSFSPTAEGVRTASLQLTSNAGTALIALTGRGLPARPIIGIDTAGLSFLPASAFDTLAVTNTGGQTLALQSITIGGAAPSAFAFAAANRGFSNCFAGILIAPLATCYVGIGLAPGAPAPSNAVLTILSNDPAHPATTIPLTLTP